MSFVESVRSFGVAQPEITALIGSRMYPLVIPAAVEADPNVTFYETNHERPPLVDGTTSSLRTSQVQLDAWSTRYDTAKDLADALIDAYVGHRGAFGTHTLDHCRLESQFDSDPEETTGRFRVTVRLFFAYT